MRIGPLAPPWIPVPRPAYGGIEQIVALLAREPARYLVGRGSGRLAPVPGGGQGRALAP
jgi:hypothetical protein